MSAPTRSTALLDEFLAAGQDVALTDESGEFPRLIAEPPELPIERGLAGPGMLADTIVRRWQDHLPLVDTLPPMYGGWPSPVVAIGGGSGGSIGPRTTC